jgi:hypothetical protein
MPLTIQNQKLFDWGENFLNFFAITPDIDEKTFYDQRQQHIEQVVIDPLFVSNNGQDVEIRDVTDPNNPVDIKKDTLLDAFRHMMDSQSIDVTLEQQFAEIMRQSSLHTLPNDWSVMQHPFVEYVAHTKQAQLPIHPIFY